MKKFDGLDAIPYKIPDEFNAATWLYILVVKESVFMVLSKFTDLRLLFLIIYIL